MDQELWELLTLWLFCLCVVKWWSDLEGKGKVEDGKEVGFEYCGIIWALFIYSLLGLSLLFIVGSLGRNKGGMVQSYFQGFHLFPGCLCVSVGIESLRNLPAALGLPSL